MEITRETEGKAPAVLLPEPASLEETGLDFELLVDLCLKTIYFAGRPSAASIAERVCLPFSIVGEILTYLRNQEILDIVGAAGITEQDYQYSLTRKGVARTQETLEGNHYVGPAPVPFDLYVDVVNRQSIRAVNPTPSSIARAFERLVFDDETLAQIGTAVGSGRSAFFYGPPGNGKSTIAECIGSMMPDDILVPYAIEIFGQIVRVHEPRIHLPGETQDTGEADLNREMPLFTPGRGRDKRWAISRRPVVITGGELNLSDLELRFSSVGKFYLSPIQLRANNGVLVIDDFGRQKARPEEILNRWMISMDRSIDHLTFQTGETATVPFDVMLIFATNLAPSQLGDEAFFRRIRHKVFIPDPDEANFREIVRREASRVGIAQDEDVTNYLVEKYYVGSSRPFRGVHPRDLVDLMVDIARYRNESPRFTTESIDRACRSYFLES